MKVVLLNGSCRANGCTFTALKEAERVLEEEGIECELVQIGNLPIRDCMACGGCAGKGHCVFDGDGVNALIDKMREADAFIFGSPVYFAHPDGRIQCLLDRAFYAGRYAFEYKPAAVIVSGRRAGTTASLDVLNKYPLIAEMPLVASSYWPMVHGSSPEQVLEDREGVQTVRNLARNMAWLMKCVELGKQNGVPAPQNDASIKTNFIR